MLSNLLAYEPLWIGLISLMGYVFLFSPTIRKVVPPWAVLVYLLVVQPLVHVRDGFLLYAIGFGYAVALIYLIWRRRERQETIPRSK